MRISIRGDDLRFRRTENYVRRIPARCDQAQEFASEAASEVSLCAGDRGRP